MDIGEIGAAVQSAASLRMQGTSRTRLEAAVRKRELIVVHRGWYVSSATWAAWFTEARHAAQAIAVARSMRGGEVVLSHTSAAVVLGLPLYRYTPRRAHVTGPRGNGTGRRNADLVRHVASVDDAWCAIEGLPVTSLARTVADVAGRLPLRTAVALVDAALRLVAWDEAQREYNPRAAERLRDAVRACTALLPGARGSVQGRWVVEFADGRAESPLESVGRLYLHQLGFPRPRVQVRIPYPGGYHDVDLSLDGADVWLEIDGSAKYTDPEMLKGATTAEAVLAEKRREDDIRGRTSRRIIRAGTADLETLQTFRDRLSDFGVRPPGGAGALPPGFSGPQL